MENLRFKNDFDVEKLKKKEENYEFLMKSSRGLFSPPKTADAVAKKKWVKSDKTEVHSKEKILIGSESYEIIGPC